MALLDFALSDLERLKSSSLSFQSVKSRKGAKLGPMLLSAMNRKAYIWRFQ